MIPFDLDTYQPGEVLFLWWLARPDTPVLIGELRIARQTKGVSLRYSEAWLKSGFPLSEDLPLDRREFFPVPTRKPPLGAVDDAQARTAGVNASSASWTSPRACPCWTSFSMPVTSASERSACVASDAYLARDMGPLPQLADASEIEELVRRILDGAPVPAQQRRLIAPGVTLGGARPKAC
jgi:serine/threonine-protein kinase HipA